MAQTTSLIITVVFGAAILYLLSRIRHIESQLKRLKQDNTEQASVQDCYEIAAQVLEERQKKAMAMRAQMQKQHQQQAEAMRVRRTSEEQQASQHSDQKLPPSPQDSPQEADHPSVEGASKED